MDDKLTERTRIHLEEQKQLLSAALAAPLMQGDKARMQDVLERARRDQGMSYLVLFDRKGKVVASSGWDKRKALPPRDSDAHRARQRWAFPHRSRRAHRRRALRPARAGARNELSQNRARRTDTREPRDRRARPAALDRAHGRTRVLAHAQPDEAHRRERAARPGRSEREAAGARRRRSGAAHARVQHHGRSAREPHPGARGERSQIHGDRRLQLRLRAVDQPGRAS